MSKYYERRLSEFDIDPKIIINKEINCMETGAAIDFSDFINLFDKNKHITSNVAKANLDISFSEDGIKAIANAASSVFIVLIIFIISSLFNYKIKLFLNTLSISIKWI